MVDDEKEIADLVEIYLVSDGYRVLKANNEMCIRDRITTAQKK